MAQKRLCMRKSKEILRLKYELGKTEREIRDICGLKSKTTVHRCLERAGKAGITWPLPEGMTEDVLEAQLFPAIQPCKEFKKIAIDCAHVHEQMQMDNVTKKLIWEEYVESNPNNHYGYTQFCQYYNRWTNNLNFSMKQVYKAGEKVFVDFGSGLSVIDKETGEIMKTHVFVAVLGASKYSYAEAVFNQDLPSWILVNRHMLEFFGCVPQVIIPDNLKAAVDKADWYEPFINRSYEEFAGHYGTNIFPTRPRQPRDKALVENGVRLVKRWILARLRNRMFFSLAELNAAIRELLEKFNDNIMKKVGKSRRELFLTLDKPNMNPLPEHPFEYAEWKKARVGCDYHISFGKHMYSVPHYLKGSEIDIRATSSIVEVYLKGNRICSHKRSHKEHDFTTVKEHMPERHQAVAGITPQSLLDWAEKTGPNVLRMVQTKLDSKMFYEQSYRSCLGILNLARKYGNERLDKACKRALHFGTMSYPKVSSILEQKLEDQEYEKLYITRPHLNHENIRGGQEFADRLLEKQKTEEIQ